MERSQFQTEIIHKCLTSSCSECTGFYVSDVLARRFICKCCCHSSLSVGMEGK
ncbi:hypothetical protein Ngar_c29190 [Candidatus Nitrososphaera gargensis Ga9.2]|uniref:Uncharacterized protein n=1 Tax=Nitrososphaera gargensis (strain Ga9.2) TaxID=1237085 RepID=K0IKM0_NITGG|nr:hypothetical protein Ngar_c29190 [Candidatus Nitrososphaera gargensis Ga9.2]